MGAEGGGGAGEGGWGGGGLMTHTFGITKTHHQFEGDR